LETRLRKALEPSQTASPRVSSNAAQIDNESLRDQILHLQKKISGLEDALDDVQSAAEKEGMALRERLKRAKDKEDAMRKELFEGRKDLDRMVKLEDTARTRVQEIEEALRESTMALENARAEVEGMRTELGVSNFQGRHDNILRSTFFAPELRWRTRRRKDRRSPF
jgi:CAP-Gly domain-containing linker protein 1